MNLQRKILIVGNWKMHLNVHQSSLLLHRLSERIKVHRHIEVALAPSMLSLQPLSQQVDHRKFQLCAQDAYPTDEGGYTGEVSFAMLGDIVKYSIVGHSARRIYFGETLEMVRDKVEAAVRNGIIPVICIGETKQERDAGESKQVVHDQLTSALMNLTSRDLDKVVLVYEPTWAISTFDGIMAKPDDVEKAIAYMRMQIQELYGERAAEKMMVLYGGSVNEHDVRSYLEVPGVDGALVGAASLNYHQFSAIVETAYQLSVGEAEDGQAD
ncbi:MAG TPA: triose-phosphate isomerase [Candidatus Saccharimonadales bacterium]|nr:triose-phosphate isomerase [Candidatus Saccharimonadales bacterium]